MSPKKIIKQTEQLHIDIIAICDHNSAGNVDAVIKAASNTEVIVIPGMEICSKEEVHILALFETVAADLMMQQFVYDHLDGKNVTSVWGDQILVNENDQVESEEWHLLIGATRLSLTQIAHKIHSLNGICIASHIDRPAFGIVNQLGFIPPDLQLDGVEVSFRIPLESAGAKIPQVGDRACITSSDAHYLNDIGRASTTFLLAKPTLREIQMALTNIDGRKIII